MGTSSDYAQKIRGVQKLSKFAHKAKNGHFSTVKNAISTLEVMLINI